MFGFSKLQYYQAYKRRTDLRDHIRGILFLFFFIVVIPLGIKLVQQQTQSAQTTKSYTNVIVSSPISSASVGDNISVAVNLIPHNTVISVVKLVLSYDKTALSIVQPFVINTLAFPTTLSNPDYTSCDGDTCYITFTVSTGENAANSITGKTTIGTIIFTSLKPIAHTQILVDSTTEISSPQNVHTDIQASPLALAIYDTKPSPSPSQPKTTNCTYQTVCLSCPVGQLCSRFSCGKQLVCVTPGKIAIPTDTPIPTRTPTPSESTTLPTPPQGCQYGLVCPTCTPGTACRQSCEMELLCAKQ